MGEVYFAEDTQLHRNAACWLLTLSVRTKPGRYEIPLQDRRGDRRSTGPEAQIKDGPHNHESRCTDQKEFQRWLAW